MYDFTTQWFENVTNNYWSDFTNNIQAENILEIGSFEGRSTVAMIEGFGSKNDISITCIDTWEGGIEHIDIDMAQVKKKFENNVQTAKDSVQYNVSITTIVQRSDQALIQLLADGLYESYDLIYVDGSHEPTDVLFDAVLSFKLLKPGGFMILDDYLYFHYERAIGKSPKIAIDGFVNTNFDKLRVTTYSTYQQVIQKME